MKFKVTMARSENRVYYFEVDAENENDAQDMAQELFSECNTEDGEIVYAEEWCQDCEQLEEVK
jgi:hypothetical protein